MGVRGIAMFSTALFSSAGCVSEGCGLYAGAPTCLCDSPSKTMKRAIWASVSAWNRLDRTTLTSSLPPTLPPRKANVIQKRWAAWWWWQEKSQRPVT